ncbi:MAG: MATE family efflux transporter [Provencibacterium sp.]|jgi:putative MATE family efflux protein|nr:MATE family efflux transporter [Provencibacterium sp.]
MHTSGKIDMTRGPIMKQVVLFALPICLGNILQQLYSTVDTLVIGNFCSSASLAAVGTSAQPVEVFLCIFLGIGNGVSILVSQHTGSGDEKGLRRLTATASSFLYLCAVPLSIAGLFLGPLILRFMQAPADIWEHAVSYLRIIFLGTLGNMGYNMNAGILRGVGDSRASLLFLLVSCAVNILLDIIFVAGFRMDVAGAALATVLAMYCSWAFSIGYIKRKYPELGYTIFPRIMDRKMLREIISVGLPLGLNNSIYSVGHVLTQSLINAQGSAFVAACSVASKVTGIANVAIQSFASAATTFSGQNLGCQNYLRLKKGGKQIPFYSGLFTGAAGLTVTLFCRPVLGLFTRDMAVIELAVIYIRVVLPFTWAFAVFNSIVCFINGMGEVKYPTVINILMLWVVRIPSAYLIGRFIDGKYLMACFPISFLFGMLCMLAYFLMGSWRQLRQLAAQQECAQLPEGRRDAGETGCE